MEIKMGSKLEKEANIYDDVYAPDNFQAFVDGAEWGVSQMCAFLRKKTYQEYPGGPMERLIDDDELDELMKEVLTQ